MASDNPYPDFEGQGSAQAGDGENNPPFPYPEAVASACLVERLKRAYATDVGGVASARAVLLALVWHGDGDTPTNKRLAALTNLSMPTVRNALMRLQREGILIRHYNPNRHELRLAEAPPPAEPEKPDGDAPFAAPAAAPTGIDTTGWTYAYLKSATGQGHPTPQEGDTYVRDCRTGETRRGRIPENPPATDVLAPPWSPDLPLSEVQVEQNDGWRQHHDKLVNAMMSGNPTLKEECMERLEEHRDAVVRDAFVRAWTQ